MKNWTAKTKSGKILNENEINWGKVDEEVISLSLNNDGQIITLPENAEKFIQGKTASTFMGTKKINIESRYIGFKVGNNIVKVRVDEKTNNISIELE